KRNRRVIGPGRWGVLAAHPADACPRGRRARGNSSILSGIGCRARVAGHTRRTVLDMARFLHTIRRLICDEFGGANTEYAIVAGLILMALMAILEQFGPRVLERWASVGQKLGGGPSTVVVDVQKHGA